MAPWEFFPWTLLFLDTLQPRVIARKAWRQCALVFEHDRYSHVGHCTGLLSNTGLFLSTGNRYLFLLQRHLFPFDSWPLLMFQFSRAWRQSFAIGVSDLYFSSPLSSIFDNWAPKSSDESPCRKIPIQFWVAWTHEADLLLELGILDYLVQSRGNLRVKHLEVWKIPSINWLWGLQFFQWLNHLHLFDP